MKKRDNVRLNGKLVPVQDMREQLIKLINDSLNEKIGLDLPPLEREVNDLPVDKIVKMFKKVF